MVGQRIGISATAAPEPTGPSWTLAADAFKDYVFTATNGRLVSLENSDLQTTNAAFYWLKGGTKDIKYTVTVAGKSISKKTSMKVNAPTIHLSGAYRGPIALDSDFAISGTATTGLYLHFGGAASTGVPGCEISFPKSDFKVLPGTPPQSCSFSQIANIYRLALTSIGIPLLANNSGNDTSFPYGFNQVGTPPLIVASDSPGFPISSDYTSVSVSDSFSMYFWYSPGYPNSKLVPLKYVSWDWLATYQYDVTAKSWKKTSAADHSVDPPLTSDVLTPPTWSRQVNPNIPSYSVGG